MKPSERDASSAPDDGSINPSMKIPTRLWRHLRKLAGSEAGMALPTALFATIASMALAGAAVISSVDVQQGTKRDSASKSAIAAADAGASVALLRLNRYASAFSGSSPCLGVSAKTLVLTTAAADGWCPAVSGTVGSSSYVYRTTPSVVGGTMSLVSTGTAGSVSRRIAITFKTTTIPDTLDAEGLIGVDEVEIDNNGDARVGVGTNGNIHVHNNGNVCGNIRHGVGKKAEFDNKATQCKGYAVTEGNISLPAVSTFMPTDIATNNFNYLLAKCTKTSPGKVPAGCETDTYTGSRTSTVPWDASTRTISTSNNTTLTLGGGDYFVCRLVLSNNSHLVMPSGAHVRVFFDTPENCGIKAGGKQIEISNNADITSTGYQPEAGKYDVPGFYVMGSTTIPTTIELSNNSGTNEFVLYAPNTNIIIKNNATYKGVIAGKTIHLENAVVEQDPGFKGPEIGGATIYQRQSYVECTGATASPPNASC
jgi:hypothetical protein